MSADNFLRVKHDGEKYLAGMCSASDPESEPYRWHEFETYEEVMDYIVSIPVLECGVEWDATVTERRATTTTCQHCGGEL